MEKRIAHIAVIVENPDSVMNVNEALHEFADFICGRMGLPVRERGVNVISIVLDAPQDIINSLAGKLGAIKGIRAKTLYAKS